MALLPKRTKWDENKTRQACRYTSTFLSLKLKQHTSKTPWH